MVQGHGGSGPEDFIGSAGNGQTSGFKKVGQLGEKVVVRTPRAAAGVVEEKAVDGAAQQLGGRPDAANQPRREEPQRWVGLAVDVDGKMGANVSGRQCTVFVEESADEDGEAVAGGWRQIERWSARE